MATYGELTFNDVVSGTIETVSTHIRPIAVYFVGLSLLGSAIELVDLGALESFAGESRAISAVQSLAGLGAGLAGLVVFVVAVIAQYLLWETMLRGHLATAPRRRYLAFLGQAILIGLGVAFGYVLLIIPGLVMTARWSLAPALIVNRNQGVIEAMGSSWDAIKGNTTPVVIAIIVGAVVLGIVAAVASGMSIFSTSGSSSPLAVVVGQLTSHAGTVLSIALGTFLYRRLYDQSDELVEVFA